MTDKIVPAQEKRAALERELAQLRTANQAATSWGAAVGARHERIKEIKSQLAGLDRIPPQEMPLDWPSREVIAREIRRAMLDNPTDPSFNKRAEQREAIANETADVILARFEAARIPAAQTKSDPAAVREAVASTPRPPASAAMGHCVGSDTSAAGAICSCDTDHPLFKERGHHPLCPAAGPPTEHQLADLVAQAVASIEGQNWSDEPLSPGEKSCIEMTILFMLARNRSPAGSGYWPAELAQKEEIERLRAQVETLQFRLNFMEERHGKIAWDAFPSTERNLPFHDETMTALDALKIRKADGGEHD